MAQLRRLPWGEAGRLCAGKWRSGDARWLFVMVTCISRDLWRMTKTPQKWLVLLHWLQKASPQFSLKSLVSSKNCRFPWHCSNSVFVCAGRFLWLVSPGLCIVTQCKASCDPPLTGKSHKSKRRFCEFWRVLVGLSGLLGKGGRKEGWVGVWTEWIVVCGWL